MPFLCRHDKAKCSTFFLLASMRKLFKGAAFSLILISVLAVPRRQSASLLKCLYANGISWKNVYGSVSHPALVKSQARYMFCPLQK